MALPPVNIHNPNVITDDVLEKDESAGGGGETASEDGGPAGPAAASSVPPPILHQGVLAWVAQMRATNSGSAGSASSQDKPAPSDAKAAGAPSTRDSASGSVPPIVVPDDHQPPPGTAPAPTAPPACHNSAAMKAGEVLGAVAGSVAGCIVRGAPGAASGAAKGSKWVGITTAVVSAAGGPEAILPGWAAGSRLGAVAGAVVGGAPGCVKGAMAGAAPGAALGAAVGHAMDLKFCPVPTVTKVEAPPPNVMESSRLRRPDLSTETKAKIRATSPKNQKGQFVDKGKVIKTETYGHKRGRENRRILAAAEQKNLTQQQLNAFVNAHPEYFKMQEAGPNFAHVDEKPGIDDLDEILEDMDEFLAKQAEK